MRIRRGRATTRSGAGLLIALATVIGLATGLTACTAPSAPAARAVTGEPSIDRVAGPVATVTAPTAARSLARSPVRTAARTPARTEPAAVTPRRPATSRTPSAPPRPVTTAKPAATTAPTTPAALIPKPVASKKTPKPAPTKPSPAPAPTPLPLPYRGSATQLITVVASSAAATSATLTAWQRSASGWRTVAGPMFAWVGDAGVGVTREGMDRTPAGVYTLTLTFGNQPNNGTRMPYFQAGPDDWWDENPASPTYNHHVVSTSSPGGASENLYYSGPAYAHAVNIDYNTFAVVPGAGSAFFLHVTEGHPTQGCVSISSGQLDAIMRWLDPAQHPVIDIGVG